MARCLEIGIPIFPGVQVLVGIFGGMEYTGTMNSLGYKSMSVRAAVGLRVTPISYSLVERLPNVLMRTS